MARTKKTYLSVDARVSEILAEAVAQSALSRRDLSSLTGMSTNRLGIILRQEPPPATVGEVGEIASALGLTASDIIRLAETSGTVTDAAHRFRNVTTPTHAAVARRTDPDTGEDQ